MKKTQRDFEDLLNTAEVKDFFFRAERELFPKMASSVMTVTIFSGKVDGKLALELGAAILLNKPILLAVIKGATVPESLRRCAHTIIELSGQQTAEDQAKVQAAVLSVIGPEGAIGV